MASTTESKYHGKARFLNGGTHRVRLDRYLTMSAGAQLSIEEQRMGTVMFLMLNPSKAAATIDDPTVARCVAFCERWNVAHLIVCNLYAVCATDPQDMLAHEEGADTVAANQMAILEAAHEAHLIVCAWGNHGKHLGRASAITLALMRAGYGYKLRVLAQNNSGHPAHPLYLPASLHPVPPELDAGGMPSWYDHDLRVIDDLKRMGERGYKFFLRCGSSPTGSFCKTLPDAVKLGAARCKTGAPEVYELGRKRGTDILRRVA